MVTQDREIVVHRRREEVFAALADAPLWTRLTPSRHGSHRYDVRIRDGERDLVFVHPPGWTRARQVMLRTLRAPGEIHVRYLRYPWPIRDFEARWTLTPHGDGATRVHLHYRMGVDVPGVGDWIGRRIILPRFYGANTDAVLREMCGALEDRVDERPEAGGASRAA